jgi:hypothetical protein
MHQDSWLRPATADCKYVLHSDDDSRTADLVLRLEKKH